MGEIAVHSKGLVYAEYRRRLPIGAEAAPAARRFLAGLDRTLGDACIGSVSEIFHAEPPYTPRGCIAQAWSVAEVLRCWAKTAE